MFSRVFLFVFAALFLFGAFYMAKQGTEYISKVKGGESTKAEIVGLLNLKIGNGKYLVQKLNSTIPDTAYSKDFTSPYSVGDIVTVYKTPDRNYIFEWNNTALYIGFLVVPLIVGLMCLSTVFYPPNYRTREVSSYSRDYFWYIFMLMGILLVLFANYGMGHINAFDQGAISTVAKVHAYESKLCKSKEDKEYQCYSRIVSYTTALGEELLVTDVASPKKAETIGDTFEIQYLKANPKEYVQRTKKDKSVLWILLATGFGIFLLAFWAYRRKVSVFVGNDE